MALLHVNYYSSALERQSAIFVVLPEHDSLAPYRTIYLLHGLSDDYTVWQRRTSVERYAERLGIMVVMPDGGRSFYMDGADGSPRYEQHILETVRFVDRTFRTRNQCRGRGIAGLSMGGYGSLRLALRHPETFCAAAAHSSVTDIRGFREKNPSPEWDRILGSPPLPDRDLFLLAQQPGTKPALRFDCGTEDFLLGENRRFAEHLRAHNVAHTYAEYPGSHTWEYWDAHVEESLGFLADRMK